MEDYTPNSHKFKEEQKTNAQAPKKVEKVVDGAKLKKKSGAAKLTDAIIAADIKTVLGCVAVDVLLPAAKKLIYDVGSRTLDMLLYGENRGRDSRGTDNISYRKYSDPRETRSRFDDTVRERPRFDSDEIVFDTRGEAEKVLDHMIDIVDSYGIVSVSEMYELSNLTQPYTSNKYGWTSLRTADVVHVRDGYVIKLPKAKPID